MPSSRRVTITSCFPADSQLFVDELQERIAEDVDEVEEGNWIDVILDAVELVVVVVLLVVVATAKKTSVEEDAGDAARGVRLPPRRDGQRDTIFEIPLDSIRI